MKSEGLAGLTTVSVDWEEPAVIILDQTQLPNREAYLRLYTPEEIWEAIYHLLLLPMAWRFVHNNSGNSLFPFFFKNLRR